MDSIPWYFHVCIEQDGETVHELDLPSDGSKNFVIEHEGTVVLLIEAAEDGKDLIIRNAPAGELVLLNESLLTSEVTLHDGDAISISEQSFVVRVCRIDGANPREEVAADEYQAHDQLKVKSSESASKAIKSKLSRKYPTRTLVAILLLVFVAIAGWLWKSSEDSWSGEKKTTEPVIQPAVTPSIEPTRESRPDVALRGELPGIQPIQPGREPWSGEVWRTDLGSPVGCVAVSGDGSIVAAGSGLGDIHLLDPDTGRELARLSLHSDSVASIALSYDGSRLLAGSYDGNASLWNVPARKPIMNFGAHTAPVRAVAMTPDGKYGLTADAEGLVIYWNLETGEDIRLLLGHSAAINGIAFSPDGFCAASSDMQGKLILWLLENGSRQFEVRFDTGINGVAFSPGGEAIAVAADNFLPAREGVLSVPGQTLHVLKSTDGTQIDHLSSTSDWLIAVAYSPDSMLLGATTGGKPDPRLNSPGPCLLKIWDIRAGIVIKNIEAHTRLITGLAFLPDSRSAITSSLDHTVRRW